MLLKAGYNMDLTIGPEVRKFFINTLFDSTFTLLGVVSGLAFVGNPDLRTIIVTLITSSIALGISSGVSVYEAECMEGERIVDNLEEAMLHNLENTMHTENVKERALFTGIVIFFTPLAACVIAITPFLMTRAGWVSINYAAYSSIALALVTLASVGTYMGRDMRGNPYFRGLRMALFGLLAFIVGYILEEFL